ncbi:hypothetical protein [Pseudomonas poae]|uniref:hypothetical protein n=1 Tax=Pseudomonas poae TaxID=200451 RepID=UPI000F4BB883|nr:hypothetical protein [Pseudomonas poae]
MDVQRMKDAMRNAAAANVFRQMGSEDGERALLQKNRAIPDVMLDFAARQSGVPNDQLPIMRAMVRGEDNVFLQELKGVDGLLQTGDLILMTGTAPGSQRLARAQKLAYPQGRSSHVAVLHADFYLHRCYAEGRCYQPDNFGSTAARAAGLASDTL